MKRLLYVFLLLAVAFDAVAQISSGGVPLDFDRSYYQGGKAVGRFHALGHKDFFINLDVDTVYHPLPEGSKRIVVGNVCSLDITPQNSGETIYTDNYRVWRVGITSSGAASIGIVFSKFNIPDGAKLFIYNPSQSTILGSFSNINGSESGILPVQPLSADSLVVEYQEPKSLSEGGFVGNLCIGSASHNFMEVNGMLKRTNPGGGITCAKQAYLTEPNNPMVEASCLIYVTGDYQSWYGSGSLINNPDLKPYIITAYHVFEGRFAPTSIFYFQNHIVMSNMKGSSELSMAGAKKVAYAEDLDLALVELNQMPPKDYRPYMAGWDANESEGYSAPYMCFHHPMGDFTKISYSKVSVVKSKTDFDVQLFKYQTFWKVPKWSVGATQGGSSGSPLLNSKSRIIGCLTGGSSSCSDPTNDYYWQLSSGWDFHADSEMRLKNWLDPHNQGIKYMDGAYLYADLNTCKRISNIDSNDVVGVQTLGCGYKGYQSGHNSLGCTAYAEHYTLERSVMVHGVYVGTYKGKYSSGYHVFVNVYEGGDTPGALKDRVELRPYDYAYKYDGTISTSIISNWNSRDNYVRFSSPVDASNDFYIGVSFENYANPDTLALYQTTNRASGNNAFFYRNGTWNSFVNYPCQPMPASLWLEPVLSFKSTIDADDTTADDEKIAVVAEYDEKRIVVSSLGALNTKNYTVMDLGGRVIKRGSLNMSDGSVSIPFDAQKGLYIVVIETENDVESHKFLWM